MTFRPLPSPMMMADALDHQATGIRLFLDWLRHSKAVRVEGDRLVIDMTADDFQRATQDAAGMAALCTGIARDLRMLVQ